MSHTPGPWTVPYYGGCIYDKHGVRILELADYNGYDLVADARLIAAAPDLLAALKAMLADGGDIVSVIEQAEAAIAKATGE